jgi:hypothetical protein
LDARVEQRLVVVQRGFDRAAELVDDRLGAARLQRVERRVGDRGGRDLVGVEPRVRSVSTKPTCTPTTCVPWRLSCTRAAFV